MQTLVGYVGRISVDEEQFEIVDWIENRLWLMGVSCGSVVPISSHTQHGDVAYNKSTYAILYLRIIFYYYIN